MSKLFLTSLTPPIAFELEQGFNTVGRNPTNSLRIRDSTVSSFHCEILVAQDAVRVHDLGSSNGTFVDGQRVEDCDLRPGCVLRLGSVELRLEERAETEPPKVVVPELPPESAPVPVILPDGCPACLIHSGTHAAFCCSRCHKHFCSDCVRILRLVGGQTRVFCPDCSGRCAPLVVPDGVTTVPPKKAPSILGRLTQTIRIRSHKG